jgi:hypothetical protein
MVTIIEVIAESLFKLRPSKTNVPWYRRNFVFSKFERVHLHISIHLLCENMLR